MMLKILQARLQKYVNRELPDVQAGFRKGRGTRDQIVLSLMVRPWSISNRTLDLSCKSGIIAYAR